MDSDHYKLTDEVNSIVSGRLPLQTKVRMLQQRAWFYVAFVNADRLKVVRPVLTNLLVTMRCNAKCGYCYADHPFSKTQELTTQQIFSLIDDLVDMGCRLINITGGEPTLRRDFDEIISYVHSKNILCDVDSNLWLIHRHIEVLRKSGHQVFTSIDGDEIAHDLNRGEGHFKRTLKGIKIVRAAGLPVRVNCTLTRHNTNQIDYLIDFAKEYNVFVTFTPLVRPAPRLVDICADMIPEENQARDEFKNIRKAIESVDRITNTKKSLDFFINYPVPLGTIVGHDDDPAVTGYYDKPCPYGRLIFYINSIGDVSSCHNMINDSAYKPKNVITHGTREAIQHAHDILWCKFCWMANLVDWAELSTPEWFLKGVNITLRQAFGKSRIRSDI